MCRRNEGRKRICSCKKDNFVKEDNKETEILEQKTAASILKNKKINFPKSHYEEHNLLQTPSEIENKRQQKIDDLLNFASAYFEEDLNATENVNRERLAVAIFRANQIIDNDLIVENEPTFKEWFFNDKFVDQDLAVSEESKAFIHDLIKITNFTSDILDYKNDDKKIQ